MRPWGRGQGRAHLRVCPPDPAAPKRLTSPTSPYRPGIQGVPGREGVQGQRGALEGATLGHQTVPLTAGVQDGGGCEGVGRSAGRREAQVLRKDGESIWDDTRELTQAHVPERRRKGNVGPQKGRL